METLYKIKSITHSGRKGNRGTPRTDDRYPQRVGRIVKINFKNMVLGIPLILDYVKDEHGNDYRDYMLRCSRIQSTHMVTNKLLVVETCNTIYEFEEVEE